MAATVLPVPIEQVARAVASLPAFAADDLNMVGTVRAVLAQAIASGQDAAELGQDLSSPGPWFAVHWQTPATTTSTTVAAASAETITVPAWAKDAAHAAVKAGAALRVAILDRDPASITDLSLPPAFRGQKPAKTYGPISVVSNDKQLTLRKWVSAYLITIQMVRFVRNKTTLFVAPLGASGNQTQVTLAAGSVWIRAASFDSSAPADAYAGLRIKGGSLASDIPLSFAGATVDVPVGADVTLAVTPLPSTEVSSVAQVTPPAQLTFAFGKGQTAGATFSPFSASVFGQTFGCAQTKANALYFAPGSVLAFPANVNQPRFSPGVQAGKLLHYDGDAPIEAAGWSLWVARATPGALGDALTSGMFYMSYGPGTDVSWTGLSRPEPQAAGIVLAATKRLLVWSVSGLAQNAISQQRIELWNDSDAPSIATVARQGGAQLVYSIGEPKETLELGGSITAQLDRPILADGQRATVDFPHGLVIVYGAVEKVAQATLLVFAGFSADQYQAAMAGHPGGFPMALDNAFLRVGVATGLAMMAQLSAFDPGAPCLPELGLLLLCFPFALGFPFLPDPYTTSSLALDADSNKFSRALLAEIQWSQAGEVNLRLADYEHPHAQSAPPSEASSELASNDSSLRPPAIGTIHLGLPSSVLKHAIMQMPPPLATHSEVPASLSMQPSEPEFVPTALAAPIPAGLLMLDLSTRASQFGVEILGYNPSLALTQLNVDGLSLRTAAILAPVITLPSIAWEPMVSKVVPESAPPPDLAPLSAPPRAPICGVGVKSHTLMVPISPIQSLGAILAGSREKNGAYVANLCLPFGMVGQIDQPVDGTTAPAPSLTVPHFALHDSRQSVELAGALQLTLRPPPADPTAPLFAGKTYVRSQYDNPDGHASYGELVLGNSVAHMFATRFAADNLKGVPVTRYDLTGFGASLFSEWNNLNSANAADIVKVDLTTTIGRTSHEVVQAKSVIHPWGIPVVRTITIKRLNSGCVERTDSGWRAVSDGHFQYGTTKSGKDISPNDVHRGLIDRLINVRNIREFGFPLKTPGTPDDPPPPQLPPTSDDVLLQPVTFDADVAIHPLHTVVRGGTTASTPDHSQYVVVPSTGVVGYVGLRAHYHLSLDDWLHFSAAQAGGPLHATVDLGKSGQLFRTVSFSAATAKNQGKAIVIAVQGLPTLPQGSAWTVAVQGPGDLAPRALDPTEPISVVQPNDPSGEPGPETHYAAASDIFCLGPNPPKLPDSLYGFLQDVGTQKTFLAQPFVANVTDASVPKQLSLRQGACLADPGLLLGSLGAFPAIVSALPLQGLTGLASQGGAQSLQLDQWFNTAPLESTILISTADCPLCEVKLLYHPGNANDQSQNIHVTVGNQSGPSWSMDIFDVALQLALPPISSDPALWIRGAFLADAESAPTLSDFQVDYLGPLAPLTQFFTTLKNLTQGLGASAGKAMLAKETASSSNGPGLDVHLTDGVLTVRDVFALPRMPLGPGYIEGVSLNIGTSIDVMNKNVDFLVGIGSSDAPVHWIVDPLAGTGVLQVGVQGGQLAVLVQLGLGLGLAIDLGIASGGVSVVIAFQAEVAEGAYELMLLLTGQAQVEVLGGVASAALSLSCGLGLEYHDTTVTAIGQASVGIHISICWVVSIDFSGGWTFSHDFALPAS
jgi:hypothetical protein